MSNNIKGATKIIIDKCPDCSRVVTDPDEVECVEITGICFECVWRKEKEETMMETNNDGEKEEASAQL
jgi:hypothetical protein